MAVTWLVRRAPRLAAVGLALTAVAFLGAVALETANGRATDNTGGWRFLALALVILTVPAVGALVAARRPENPVGWLALGAPMATGFALLAHAYAVQALRVSGGERVGGTAAAWVATWLGALGLGLLPFLVATFPSGRVAPGLRRPVRFAVVALFVACLAQAVAPDHLDGVSSTVEPIANPLGVRAAAAAVGGATTITAGFLSIVFLAALADLVVRAARGTPTERRQLRWLVVALAFLPAGALVAIVGSAVGEERPTDVVLTATQLVAIVGSAAALAIGVLYDGIFDLRDYARRVALGAALSAGIVVGFIAVVSIIATLTSASGAAPPAVAAAVVAIALGPLRGRLQRAVDHLLFGWRSEPFRILTELGERLEVTPTTDAALPAVVETIASGLRLPYARIDLDLGADGLVTVAVAGAPVDHVMRLPLLDSDRVLGELVVGQRSAEEAFRADELELLGSLARQAGAAARAAQLTAELRVARARLVRSHADERRRLQRELHDGVGPALAGLGLQLDAALDIARSDPAGTAELLASMQHSLRATGLEVRRIAHDLRPGVLDELGLLEAVRAQAHFLATNASNPLEVLLDLSATADASAAVEVAVYRIASEALTNVIRHANAHTCTLRLCVNGPVELDVADDGIGFLPERTLVGLGLRSMRERVNELGGTFNLSSRSPTGTLIEVRLPVRQ